MSRLGTTARHATNVASPPLEDLVTPISLMPEEASPALEWLRGPMTNADASLGARRSGNPAAFLQTEPRTDFSVPEAGCSLKMEVR